MAGEHAPQEIDHSTLAPCLIGQTCSAKTQRHALSWIFPTTVRSLHRCITMKITELRHGAESAALLGAIFCSSVFSCELRTSRLTHMALMIDAAVCCP